MAIPQHTLDPDFRRALVRQIVGTQPLPDNVQYPYGRHFNPITKDYDPIQGPANVNQIWPQMAYVGTDFLMPIPADRPLLRNELRYLRIASDRLGRVKLVRFLGEGAHGTVWLARCERPGQPIRQLACKVLSFDDEGGLEPNVMTNIEALLNDSRRMEPLNHPNICQLIETITIPDSRTGFPYSRCCIFMEMCQANLETQLNSNHVGLPQAVTLIWFRGIARAVQYLHGQRVVHMDIKPGNILFQLFTPDGQPTVIPKLCDFGASVAFPAGVQMWFDPGTYMGTDLYMAPEMEAQMPVPPPAVGCAAMPCDIFSLGMSLAESLIGYDLFDGLTKVEVQNIGQNWAAGQPAGHNIHQPVSPDPQLGQLMASMLNPNPNQRPNIDQVVANPLLA